MPKLFVLSQLRFYRRQPLQLFLALMGIAFGVAVVVAIDLTRSTAEQAFVQSQQAFSQSPDYLIRSKSGAMSWREYSDLLNIQVWSRRHIFISATAEREASLLSRPELALRLRFVDLVQQLNSGAQLSADNAGFNVASLSRGFVASPASVRRYGFTVGQQYEFSLANNTFKARFNGSYPGQDVGQVVFDLSRLAKLAGTNAPLSQVSVYFKPAVGLRGERKAAALETLERALPEQLVLQNFQQHKKDQLALTDSFFFNLSALSLLALLVGAFLIFNTVQFSLYRRLNLLALQRLIGVSKQQLFVYLLLEGGVIALAGSVLGVLLGIFLAQGSTELVLLTLNNLYFDVAQLAPEIGLLVWLKGLVLGFVVGVVAVFKLAHTMTQKSALSLSYRISQETRNGSLWLYLLIVVVGIILLLGLWLQSLWAGYISLAMAVFLMALLTPTLLRWCCQLALIVLRGSRFLLLLMAFRNVVANLSRTSVAALALLLALSASNGMEAMISSFKSNFNVWLEQRIGADWYVPLNGQIEADWMLQWQKLQGVNNIGIYRHNGEVLLDAKVHVSVNSLQWLGVGAPQGKSSTLFVYQKSADCYHKLRNGQVFISEAMHRLGGYQTQGKIELNGVSARIACVQRDFGAGKWAITVGFQHFQQLWPKQSIQGLMVYLEPGLNAAQRQRLQQRLLTLVPEPLNLIGQQDIKQRALTMFDQTFKITSVLRVLSLFVAVIAVVNAFVAVLTERRRDAAVMRCLGLTRYQLVASQLFEMALLGVFIGLLAHPFGQMFSWYLLEIINVRAFGWGIEYNWTSTGAVWSLCSAVLAALSAGFVTLVGKRESLALMIKHE